MTGNPLRPLPLTKMASKLLQFPVQTIKTSAHLHNLKHTDHPTSIYLFTKQHQLQTHTHLFGSIIGQKSRIPLLFPKCALSSPKPPTTREEATLQARTSLSSTLEKPLNNLRLAGKIKKIKQPMFRVEIPVIDDSASSLAQLAVEVFQDMPIRRKGSKTKIAILWTSDGLAQAADKVFGSSSSNILIQNIDMSLVLDEGTQPIASTDVAVFMAPDTYQLEIMKMITDSLNPRPVVIFNPRWGPEEEVEFGEMSSFVGSFEVVYSFMGLEVRGILSNRKGVVFKCARDGVVSGERWNVMVEEEAGELRVVTTVKARPSIIEVENVLYNLMAMNSPVTKSSLQPCPAELPSFPFSCIQFLSLPRL